MNSRNPYLPPEASIARAPDVHPRERSPRPLSAWLVQLVLVAIFMTLAVAIWQVGWVAALYGDQEKSPWRLAGALAWRIPVCAGAGYALVAIHRARPAGRWLGLAVITTFVVLMFLAPDRTEYADDAQRAGGTLGRFVFLPLLAIWWAYAFGFSQKSRRYFARRAP